MNLTERKYVLVLYLTGLLLSDPGSIAQTPYDSEFEELASGITEQLQVFTDRSVYIMDEDILFRADHRLKGLGEDTPWSSVLYVELVDAIGITVEQGKYRICDGAVSGAIHIPVGILTGDYHLKSYTRWMRNSGPGTFSYHPLKIINPFRTEVVAHPNGITFSEMLPREPFREEELNCNTDLSQYYGGDEVLVKMQAPSDFSVERLHCCVTVVPAGTIDLSSGQYLIQSEADERKQFKVTYLPDLGSGVSLSGSVVDPDQTPVPYANLHFSILGATPDFYVSTTDKHGRFVLSVEAATGKHDFFVTPEMKEDITHEVRIDQDSDSRSVALPIQKFNLAGTEKEAARKMALNMQLSKAFLQASHDITEDSLNTDHERAPVPFYGIRVKRLLIDDYIKLPNVEEVFINLIPEVQFYKKRGRTMIRIRSNNNSIGVYDPLIMIDNISVFDLEALLALSPEKIERIDLIDEIYLKGNMVFGGVLALYSRKGDLAGIDLPRGAYFFDLQSTQPEVLQRKPEYRSDKRIPDTRNTILWLGDVLLEKGKQVDISFQAPETPGEYVVLVRGFTPNGFVMSATSRFWVE
ncbi:MAG: hypothetical protein KAR19_15740 [Bacteroidales bacterium]|nr:hypothetical protein [Bacteroidales bacterium]